MTQSQRESLLLRWIFVLAASPPFALGTIFLAEESAASKDTYKKPKKHKAPAKLKAVCTQASSTIHAGKTWEHATNRVQAHRQHARARCFA